MASQSSVFTVTIDNICNEITWNSLQIKTKEDCRESLQSFLVLAEQFDVSDTSGLITEEKGGRNNGNDGLGPSVTVVKDLGTICFDQVIKI